jgi:hypothetical protein
MDQNKREVLDPITNLSYFKRLIKEKYVLEGPRKNSSNDVVVFKRILRKGYEFIPEDWLKNRGYKFVEPSEYTKGYKLAYKMKGGFLDQFFKSNYSLSKNNIRIFLYLKFKNN